ncbi:hypothetical protein [Hafnia alvei]|jgi:hypothetical protein
MRIPQPAKRLCLIDDGWSNLLDKHGDAIPEWTQLVAELHLACAVPVPWDYADTAALNPIVYTLNTFAIAEREKAAAPAG